MAGFGFPGLLLMGGNRSDDFPVFFSMYSCVFAVRLDRPAFVDIVCWRDRSALVHMQPYRPYTVAKYTETSIDIGPI